MSSGRTNLKVAGVEGPSQPFNDMRLARPIHQRRGWAITSPYVQETFEIPANSQTTHSRGGQTVFEIDRRCDQWGAMLLRWSRAAITQGTSTNTRPMFVDWEGPRSIDFIDFLYETKVFYRVHGESLVEEYRKFCDSEAELEGLGMMCLGLKSEFERQDLAASAQTVWADLRVPWSHMEKYLPAYAIPNKIRVEVNWIAEARILHNAGGTDTGGGITEPVMVCKGIHRTERQRQELHAETWSKLGWRIKTKSIERHYAESITSTAANYAAASAARTVTIDLKNIRNNVYYMSVKARYAHDMNNILFTDHDRYLPIISCRLLESGNAVSPYYRGLPCQRNGSSNSLNVYYDNVKAFPHQGVGLPEVSFFFCQPEHVKDSEHDCYGSRDIYKYNNPAIEITYNEKLHFASPYPTPTRYPAISYTSPSNILFAASGGAPILFDVVAYVHQMIIVNQANISRYLST